MEYGKMVFCLKLLTIKVCLKELHDLMVSTFSSDIWHQQSTLRIS